MQRFIRDPEFEADFIEDDDYECLESFECESDEEYFGERLSVFTESYMKIKNIKVNDLEDDEQDNILYLLRSMISMMEELTDKKFSTDNLEVIKREMIYVVFKTMNTELAIEYMKTHHLFAQYCIDLAEKTLDQIAEFKSDLWRNTQIAIDDFLYQAEKEL